MKHVYFMRPVGKAGPVKIGSSSQPMKRLRTLEIWSPFKLEMVAHAPGSCAHERILHYRFGAHRLHGEWFKESPELNALIAHVASTGTLPPMEIPQGPAEWGEAVHKAKGRTRRNPHAYAVKCRLTKSITAAEQHAFGFEGDARRPDEIITIIASYQGFCAEMPSAADLAMIDEYCATLLAMPKVGRNWENWKAFAAKRDAGRAA